VSNGLCLRILRDNASLTRQAYVEFDLKGMMKGEVYADFTLLWLLGHQSRVEAERPESCWLEKWSQAAQVEGTRALDQLQKGVERAIAALGRGFLDPANSTLREKLRTGILTSRDYYRQLLRLIYRLLFLFVAEDRGLLLERNGDSPARERYTRYYSTARIRRLATQRRGTRHWDLYEGLRVVMKRLGSDQGCPELSLPALGSFLFSDRAIPDLLDSRIANRDFLEAVRDLAQTDERDSFRLVDYKNLGSEELGSVYESLLELHPEVNIDAGDFALVTSSGHERKSTGSYYTPTSLITCLLDSALDPVIEEAAKRENPEQARLSLKVCDPACGSGHFLIAAAHRIARRLAAVRTGDEEPSPEATRRALRDVIGRCIYGVDVNEMAVELCKVALWMEALEPGMPLSFLDHRIQCGNSLLGTTPGLLANGIPDAAFTAIEGDDKSFTTSLQRRNREERAGQMALPMVAEEVAAYGNLSEGVAYLDTMDDTSISGVQEKEARYERLSESDEYRKTRLLADAWCAAFVWRKMKDAPDR
jgi:N-6 DNA Methylase